MTRRFGSRGRGDQYKFDGEAHDDGDTGDSRGPRRVTNARHEIRKAQRQQRGGDEELEGLHPQRFTEDRSIIDNDQKSRHHGRDDIDDRENELEPIQGEARHATTLNNRQLINGINGEATGIRTPDRAIGKERFQQFLVTATPQPYSLARLQPVPHHSRAFSQEKIPSQTTHRTLLDVSPLNQI